MKRVRYITRKGLLKKVRAHVQAQLDIRVGDKLTIDTLTVDDKFKYVYVILQDMNGHSIRRLACTF